MFAKVQQSNILPMEDFSHNGNVAGICMTVNRCQGELVEPVFNNCFTWFNKLTQTEINN